MKEQRSHRPKNAITAETAHAQAMQHLEGPVIEPYLELSYTRIRERMEAGQFTVNDPWISESNGQQKLEYPSLEIQEAVKSALRKDGYIVKDMPDPDPGAPGSHAYTSVSW